MLSFIAVASSPVMQTQQSFAVHKPLNISNTSFKAYNN